MKKKKILVASAGSMSNGYANMIYNQLDRSRFEVFPDFMGRFGENMDLAGQIDLCVVMHGNRSIHRHTERFKYLDKICGNVWCAMDTHLSDYILYDKEGYSGGSSLARNPSLLDVDSVNQAEANRLFEELQTKYIKGNVSKYPQPAAGYTSKDPYLVVMAQVPFDTAVLCGTFYDDYLLTMLTALPALNTFGIKVVYKPHPKALGRHSEALESLIASKAWPNVSLSGDVSMHSLIRDSLGVVTVNSGSGFEALLHLKHVFTLGYSDYSLAAHPCRTQEEIYGIKDILGTPVDENHIKRFVKGYLDRAHRKEGKNPYNSLVEHLLDMDPAQSRLYENKEPK